MNDRHYEAWRQARRTVAPPEGFADRVMSNVRRTTKAKPHWANVDLTTWIFSRRYVAAALFVVAAGLGLLRLVSVAITILATPSGGF